MRGVTRDARCCGSIVKVTGSTSTTTGTAPIEQIAAIVATAVWATVNTSSPGATSQASNASRSASVPDATPIPQAAWQKVAKACSNR